MTRFFCQTSRLDKGPLFPDFRRFFERCKIATSQTLNIRPRSVHHPRLNRLFLLRMLFNRIYLRHIHIHHCASIVRWLHIWNEKRDAGPSLSPNIWAVCAWNEKTCICICCKYLSQWKPFDPYKKRSCPASNK